MKQLIILLLFIAIISGSAIATTWDEPWQDKVIKEAESFVLANIISADEKKGIKIEIIKTLAGKTLKSRIQITDFYLLELCSMSGGHGPEFHTGGAKESYFFIKKNSKGKYCIATPTTGFDVVLKGQVRATYRHSYHQALVPAEIYEKTMLAIFNNYHNLPYDKQSITEYVSKYLSLKPAGFSQEEIEIFFAQHVALECAYHLRLTGHYSNIITFLNDTSNFHNQISAARALISYNTPECKMELIKVIGDTARSNFVQIMCIQTIAEFKPVELKQQLAKIKETASSEENGFGGNIMDPRVCTSIPDVKSALENLLAGL